MLNVLKLSELLTKNVDPKLYPRMFLMAPNGTLIAYSTPVDIKELRDQAALISMAWKDHEAAQQTKGTAAEAEAIQGEPTKSAALETLSIEFQQNNIIVRALQPQLLLVLVGNVPPNRKDVFKMTPEAVGDPRYPAIAATENNAPETSASLQTDESPKLSNKPSSIASHMSERDQDIHNGTLHIQRKKIDALSDYIRKDFASQAFVMPEDSTFP
ncbi:hypothetical protein P154DRAFT_439103 [Amniculicola lignicola CBS 123094]|uniref:Roadblock/LAMTOR2 domain-containing protein n=1 Tax=Amniculicola lignicola CBS 123094 TaxID=1392246 RepID=A0A6A5WLM2_9PLEO|nr:hypothetical protein P154DRAFT_439103 [Amniculicola lignicola CBS 123094]